MTTRSEQDFDEIDEKEREKINITIASLIMEVEKELSLTEWNVEWFGIDDYEKKLPERLKKEAGQKAYEFVQTKIFKENHPNLSWEDGVKIAKKELFEQLMEKNKSSLSLRANITVKMGDKYFPNINVFTERIILKKTGEISVEELAKKIVLTLS